MCFSENFGGFGLHSDYPPLGLHRGCRLMESGPISDIADLSRLEFPCELTFFDSTVDGGLNFVSPLLVSIPGFGVDSLHLDVMHILDLGVSQYLIGAVFKCFDTFYVLGLRPLPPKFPMPRSPHPARPQYSIHRGCCTRRRLIDNNFAGSDHVYVHMRRQANLRALRKRLKVFYKSFPTERGRMTKIGKLTMKMIGGPTTPCLVSKAAEARHLIPLLPQLCREYPRSLGAGAFLLTRCCNFYAEFFKCMKSEPRDMSPGGLRTLESSMSRFLASWKAWGGHCVPKHHMAWHLVQRARQHGNPKFYWTYADEGENRMMSSVAKSLSGTRTFYLTMLQKVLPEAGA